MEHNEPTSGARPAPMKDLGLHLPTGDLGRDLSEKRRVPIRVGIVQHELRTLPDDGEGVVEVIASTDGVKRDGNRVRNDGWSFRDFRKNPAMTWCHDWTVPLIGAWREESIVPFGEGKALRLVGQFALGDEFASRIYRLYRDKIMRTWSIEWTPDEYQEMRDPEGRLLGWDFIRNTLLGCAAVPMPADPDAITLAVRSGTFSADEAASFHRMIKRDAGIVYQLSHLEPPSPSSSAPTPDQARDALSDAYSPAASEAAAVSDTVDHRRFWAEVGSALSGFLRGAMSDELEIACDRMHGACLVAGQVMSQLHTCAAMTDTDGDYGEMMRAECQRHLSRLDALFTDARDAVAEMRGVLSDAENPMAPEESPYPEEEPGEPMMPMMAEDLSASQSKTRIGKKIAKSRLEMLKECERCLDTAMGHVRTVIDEAEPGELDAESPKASAAAAACASDAPPPRVPEVLDLSAARAVLAAARTILPKRDPVASLRQSVAALSAVTLDGKPTAPKPEARSFGRRKTDFRKLARGL